VLNIAHRGARSLAPENTLAAARKAYELGSDMWELDVNVTADGELIVFHDGTLDRVSDAEEVFPDRAPWSTHSFTLAELKRLDLGTMFNERDPFGQIAAGAVSGEERLAWRGEEIPTLREALAFTQANSWRVNIEIKPLPSSLANFPIIEKSITLIQELDMAEQVILSSFCDNYIQAVKRLNRAVSTAILRGAWFSGDALSLVRQLESKIYHPFYTIAQEDDIKALKQEGIEVNIWTVNREIDLEHFAQSEVTGIMTDFPQSLKAILSSRDDKGNEKHESGSLSREPGLP
jgi:glycerophosphoryl diester phosphodiesterase